MFIPPGSDGSGGRRGRYRSPRCPRSDVPLPHRAFHCGCFTDEVCNSQLSSEYGSLYAGRFKFREKQHVSFTSSFSAPPMSRIVLESLGRDSKGDPAGRVGLDDARDDVYRRTLGRNDQMDARSSCKLGQADDGSLTSLWQPSEICRLIDDDDQSGRISNRDQSPLTIFV